MVRSPMLHRKAAFKAALTLARMTAAEWCEARSITPHHLYAVFRGDRESKTLINDIDQFIAKYPPSTVAAA